MKLSEVPPGTATHPGRNGGTLVSGGQAKVNEGRLDALVEARVAGFSIAKAAAASGWSPEAAREVVRRPDVAERIEQGKTELTEELRSRINAASGEVIRVHLDAMRAVDKDGYPTTVALRAAENLLSRLAPATQRIDVETQGQPRETPEERDRRLNALLANIEARLALPDGERERQVVDLVADEQGGIEDGEVVE